PRPAPLQAGKYTSPTARRPMAGRRGQTYGARSTRGDGVTTRRGRLHRIGLEDPPLGRPTPVESGNEGAPVRPVAVHLPAPACPRGRCNDRCSALIPRTYEVFSGREHAPSLIINGLRINR